MSFHFSLVRGANHDLVASDVIPLSSFDSTPPPPDKMDYFIDPTERSQSVPHSNEFVDYIDRSFKMPPNFSFLMTLLIKPNNLTLCTSNGPVSVHTIFPDIMEVYIDVSQLQAIMRRNSFMPNVSPMTSDYHHVDPLKHNIINDSIQIEIPRQVMDVLRTC